jgi:hypothetical protein
VGSSSLLITPKLASGEQPLTDFPDDLFKIH